VDDVESLGRPFRRGIAAGELSRAGLNGPVKLGLALRSLCFGSVRKLAGTFRNLPRTSSSLDQPTSCPRGGSFYPGRIY
jgi:hypothetical protein